MLKKDVDAFFLNITFVLYVISWVLINTFSTYFEATKAFDYYADSYGVIALIGFFIGYRTSKRFGGIKSIFGKAVLLLSFGLFSQFLGQLSYGLYYYVFNVENPYPSFGDIFYFLTIPFYIISLVYFIRSLGKIAEIKLKVRELGLSAAVIMLFFSFSYFMFVKGTQFPTIAEPITFITFFLEVGYPLGQTTFVLLALLLYKRSYNYLGGYFRKPILYIILALVMQYISDTYFLYKTYADTWRAAGPSDFLFVISYFLMGYSFYLIRQAYYKIHE